jgi:hypothetical protein
MSMFEPFHVTFSFLSLCFPSYHMFFTYLCVCFLLQVQRVELKVIKVMVSYLPIFMF